GVVAGEETLRGVIERDRAAADDHCSRASRGKLMHTGDVDELLHWRRRRVALHTPDRPRNPIASDIGLAIAPHAGNRRRALRTLAVFQAECGNAKAVAIDHDGLAHRTVRSFEIAECAGNVAGIDVAQSSAFADLI